MKFKIDKGVAIPGVNRNNRGSGAMQILVQRMECGDSVLVPNKKDRNNMTSAMRRNKVKYATRIEGTGFRVWKLKNESDKTATEGSCLHSSPNQ